MSNTDHSLKTSLYLKNNLLYIYIYINIRNINAKLQVPYVYVQDETFENSTPKTRSSHYMTSIVNILKLRFKVYFRIFDSYTDYLIWFLYPR